MKTVKYPVNKFTKEAIDSFIQRVNEAPIYGELNKHVNNKLNPSLAYQEYTDINKENICLQTTNVEVKDKRLVATIKPLTDITDNIDFVIRGFTDNRNDKISYIITIDAMYKE